MAWSQFQQIIDNPQLVKDFPEDLLTLMALNKYTVYIINLKTNVINFNFTEITQKNVHGKLL